MNVGPADIFRNNYGCSGESLSVLPVCSAAIRCFEHPEFDLRKSDTRLIIVSSCTG